MDCSCGVGSFVTLPRGVAVVHNYITSTARLSCGVVELASRLLPTQPTFLRVCCIIAQETTARLSGGCWLGLSSVGTQVYQYCFYANYPAEKLAEKNPEIPDDD